MSRSAPATSISQPPPHGWIFCGRSPRTEADLACPHTPNVPKREWPNPGPHDVTAVDDECGGSYRCGILGFSTR